MPAATQLARAPKPAVAPSPSPAPKPAPPAPVAKAPTPAPAPAPVKVETPAPPSTPAAPEAPAADSGDSFKEFDASLRKHGFMDTPAPAVDETPVDEPSADAPPADKPPVTQPQVPPQNEGSPAKKLRDELERTRKEHGELQRKHTEAEARLRELNDAIKDKEALSNRATDLEKTLAEREAELYMFRHESSPEFKEKHDKPFTEAATYAQAYVEQLVVTDPESGTPRQAAWDDFKALYGLPVGKAYQVSKELFGEAAGQVMAHYHDLKKLDFQKSRAMQEQRANAQERIKQEEGRRAQQVETLNKTFRQANTDLVNTVDGYRDDPTDKEMVEARTKGYGLFDQNHDSLEKKVLKDAHIRQRVAAYGPMQIRIMRLEKELADVKAKSERARPTPGNTIRPGGDVAAPKEGDWVADAIAAVKNA